MFNPDQLTAINATGNTLVVAGPGSGKTSLSIGKAELLLSNPENKVIAVTFTRASATELKHRAFSRIADRDAVEKRFASGTFHSLILRQLERAHLPVKLMKNSMSDEFTRMAWQAACASAKQKISLEEAKFVVMASKARMHYQPASELEEILLGHYQALLDKHGHCDMQDVIPLAVRGMRSGVVPALGCTHLLVDEFQDADEPQLMWVLEHAKKGVTVMCVGDDDQAIYGFRESLGYVGMTGFRDKTQAQTVTLNANYRCHQEILESAVDLIALNKNRLAKQLTAERGSGGKVTLHEFGSADAEAALAVEHIKEAPETWAVLARTNLRLTAIEMELASQGVPYYRLDKDSIWTARPVAVALSLLDYVTRHQSGGLDFALGFAGLDAQSIQNIHEQELAGMDTQDVAHFPAVYVDLKQKLKGWADKEQPASLIIASVFAWVGAKAADSFKAVITVACNALCDMKGSIPQRLASIERGRKEKEKSGVALITMHSSKGLEFPNVWIIGAEHGLCPSPESPIDDERRLFYVAMTRAMNTLHISYCQGTPEKPVVASEFFVHVQQFLAKK